MKSTLVRIFAIMTLATSMSAFAMPEKGKDNNTTNSSKTNAEETTVSCPADQKKSEERPDKDNDQARQEQIEKQNQQWLHDLQGYYGG